jgi:hypothetical protein
MCRKMLVSGAATVYGTVALLVYPDRKVALVAGAKASFVGYIDAKICVPLPTLYGQVNVKH